MVASDGVKSLEGLNPQQKEAVLHTSGPLLIVAGAGAGKTKTITHRIAHLITSGVPPRSILALTFTNKAAGEMRERVGRLLGTPLPTNPFLQGNTPLVTTFHSLGVRILREFADRAGIPRSFSIWDRDDSVRALKRISEVDGGQFPPQQLLARISREKGNSVTAEAFEKRATSFYEEAVAEAWRAYESALLKEGALDFDDLLLRTLALLKNDRGTLQKLQSRWQHLMIDEYQDTNQTQYHIARLIAGDRKSICAVGDVDQCLVGGTPITMADGSKKVIERVQMGDMVRANYGSGDFRPARVSHTQTRLHEGVLIRITTQAGRIIESTPEHIHFAGYRLGLSPQTYFIYLMYKRGKGFRLGVSRVYTRGQIAPMLGFKQRNNHEHADSVWIIDTFETPNKARIAEYTLSLRYRIPTLPFVARKGTSTRGYVHDQHALDSIFSTFDTEKAGAKLLADHGLSRAHPHHHAQSSKRRNNLVVTLCGERRGRTPMHRVSLAASNSESRRTLEKLGYSVRNTTRNPDSWRFETAHKSYGVLCERVRNILGALPDAHLVEMARLGGKKKRLGDGNSLPFMPASSVRKGMALFDEEAGYDIVKHVEHIEHTGTVHDLDIEGVHNFIANGIITHNCLYSWRGADVANLLSFEKTFPGTKVVLLEENYRSTQTILTAANAVIAKNTRRFEKSLITGNPPGESITLVAGETDRDEAFFSARSVRELLGSGVRASEIAVLFRENFQSRALEEAFIQIGLPYRVLGVRFFDRAEVKDMLAYLRGALNPASFIDFYRPPPTPSRERVHFSTARLPEAVCGMVPANAPYRRHSSTTSIHASLVMPTRGRGRTS